jgi:hypothetical protein
LSAKHTIDSSSAVRVTDVKGPLHAHSGVGALLGNRQTANRPGIQLNLSWIRFRDSLSPSPEIVGMRFILPYRDLLDYSSPFELPSTLTGGEARRSIKRS